MFTKLKYLVIYLFLPSLMIANESPNDTIIIKEPYFININSGLNYSFSSVTNTTFKQFNTDFSQSVGSGLGFNVNAGIYYLLSKKMLSAIHFGYSTNTIVFRNSNNYPIRNFDLTDTNNVEIDNVLNNQMNYLSFIPTFSYKIFDTEGIFDVYCSIGMGIAFALKNQYTLNYEITSPKYVRFKSNNSKEKIISEGVFQDINKINFPIKFSMNSNINFGQYWGLTIDIGYRRLLNNIFKYETWKDNSAYLSLGLNYYFHSKKIIHKEIEKEKLEIVTDTTPLPYLSVEILEDSSEFYFKKGEELIATPPLVNSVFFMTNSSEIPKIYITENTDELPSLLNTNILDLKKFLFIRIKEILDENRNAKMTILGYTSGEKFENDNFNLARQRAENVKKVFINLGIDSSRIKIKYDIFPPNPSNMEFKEGILENQRADLLLEDAPYQKFVNLIDYIEISGMIKVKIDFSNLELPIKLISNLSEKEIIIKQPGIYGIPFSKRINNNKFNIEIEVISENISAKDSVELVLDNNLQHKSEISFNNFQAIMLFEYGSDELSKENKSLLDQIINYLKDGDKLIIQGSADALGQELKNKELTYLRAKNAMDYIQSHTSKKLQIEVNDNYKKFNELTPEGRFLNRAISIKIIRETD